MKLLIGADKGGAQLKDAIAQHLTERGVEFEDLCAGRLDEPHTFTRIADMAGELISSGEADRAILLCGTGMGMAIVANKHKGVYAAVVESEYAAVYSRKINDANVLCLGGFIIAPTMGCEIADAFLDTEFVEEFPRWRVDFLHGQKSALAQLEERRFA